MVNTRHIIQRVSQNMPKKKFKEDVLSEMFEEDETKPPRKNKKNRMRYSRSISGFL